MSLADSLYNLQLVQEFCKNNLNHCCHFSPEDMLYAHASIKVGTPVFKYQCINVCGGDEGKVLFLYRGLRGKSQKKEFFWK